MIILLKSKACINESLIYKKYIQQRYESVALKDITIEKSYG